jgi:hypothetical protein
MSKPMNASGQAISNRVRGGHVAAAWDRIVLEIRQLLVMFLYLFVLIGLFTLYEHVVLAERHISYAFYGFALVNALVLAKVMLVADDLHVGRKFEDRPLIYPVLAKSVLFAVVFLCFRTLEDLLVGWWEGKTFGASLPSIGGGGITGILFIGIIMAFALMPFFAFTHISRLLGPGVLRALIFKHRPRDVILELKLRAQASE